jgi:hypothetical protein
MTEEIQYILCTVLYVQLSRKTHPYPPAAASATCGKACQFSMPSSCALDIHVMCRWAATTPAIIILPLDGDAGPGGVMGFDSF